MLQVPMLPLELFFKEILIEVKSHMLLKTNQPSILQNSNYQGRSKQIEILIHFL